MATDRVQTLTRIYERWARGDMAASVGVMAENVVLRIHPELPEAGTYEGLTAIREYTVGFLDAWDSLTISALSFREGAGDAGDAVLVDVRQDGTGADSGAQVGFAYFHLWTFRGDEVVRIEAILREDEALGAAGLG